MIGLAAAAILLAPAVAGAGGHPGRPPLSVVVHATGARDVSYAIDVHNSADRPVADAVVTQLLPPGLDYLAATPPARRTGRRLTWTLAIPAHGTLRIVTTTVGGHRLGARPLAHVTQAGAAEHGHHGRHLGRAQPATTVCAGEDAGPQACATGPGARPARTLTHWEHIALLIAGVGGAAAVAALFAGRWARRRRRRAGVLERAGVEG
jgi:uncharacterized repeat protein (TIGR01451 family)